MPDTPSVRNVDTLTFTSAVIPLPIMDTEDYLWQSIDNIPAILIKSNTQLPFYIMGKLQQVKLNPPPISCNVQYLPHH